MKLSYNKALLICSGTQSVFMFKDLCTHSVESFIYGKLWTVNGFLFCYSNNIIILSQMKTQSILKGMLFYCRNPHFPLQLPVLDSKALFIPSYKMISFKSRINLGSVNKISRLYKLILMLCTDLTLGI